MTKANAEAECARLAEEHPDRETHQWHPRQQPDDDWSVVKVALPPVDPQRQAEIRADEQPPTGEDVRSAAGRNLGPNVGPGF